MKNRILFVLLSSILFLSCNQKNNSVFNDGTIAHFSDFRGSNILKGNNSFLDCDKFEYPVNLATEDLDFVAKVKLNTSSVFGLCRLNFEGKGTMFLINDSIVEINRVDTLNGSNIYTFKLPFRIKENSSYIIRLYKENKNVFFSIISENNELYVNEAIYSEDKDFGRNWGNPSVFCLNGNIEVLDAFLRNPIYNKPSVGIFGDSFIEGWGVIDNLDKRYVALLQNILGSENTYISGRGGETTTTLLSRFDAELTSIQSDYVLLAIGTNDTDISTYKANIETLISKVKSNNKTPILVTITPRLGFPIEDINNYVRNSGELFIDMNKAVNNGSETSWNPLFVNPDGIHPNIAGNKAMFNKIFFDLYFLLNTKDIFNSLK